MTKSSISVFTVYVLSQTLTNAARLMPLKWTNAIRMHLAIIPRAHTNVLAILCIYAWRRWNLYFVSHFECSSVLLRVDFHPKFTSKMLTFIWNSHRRHLHLGGINLRFFVLKNESLLDCVLNDLTTLHELSLNADMTRHSLGNKKALKNPWL